MKKSAPLLVTLLLFSVVMPAVSVPSVVAVEDSWASLVPMPTARGGLGVAVVDGKIYAIGGFNGTALSTNEMYDPETDTWTTLEHMPTARWGFGIAVVDNKIYVIAGNTRYDSWTTKNEVYDPVTDTWETKTSMPVAGMAMSANVVNGEIYLISGLEMYYLPYYNLDENQVYDPKTDSWTTKTPIPNPVFDYGSAVVDDKIYIIGGRDLYSDPDEQNFTQIYEPKTDTWNSGKPVPTAINGQATVATSGVFAPKRIHLLKMSLHYVYDPENDSWTQETPMLTPRSATGVVVVNDEIYVIGGYDGENYRNENEKYTPADYIPEFPSWIIMPMFLIAVVVAVIFKKRLCQSSERF